MDRDFALRFVERMLAADLASLAPMLAEDVVWHLPPFAQSPPRRGREAVVAFLRRAQAKFYEPGSLRLEPHLVVADADGAAVLGTLRARTLQGRDYENLYSFTLRVAGGRVVEAWELLDSALLMQQMRGGAG